VKILFIEDNYYASAFEMTLRDNGYNVYRAKNMFEASEAVLSGEIFDAAIIDLAMDKRDLPPELRECAVNQYAGWVFYQHVLRTVMGKDVIILSGYIKEFAEITAPEEYAGITFINKGDMNAIKKVFDALEEIEERIEEQQT
jgi:CheY-like chemotaxis protein